MLVGSWGFSLESRTAHLQRERRLLTAQQRSSGNFYLAKNMTLLKPIPQTMSSLIVTAAMVLMLCVTSTSAETGDELYGKAKAEKELVLWGGGPAANYERAARAFEKQ